MGPYDAWLVDLDGTLYEARPLKLRMLLRLAWAGPRTILVLRSFRHEHERMRREALPALPSPFAEQISRTAARLRTTQEHVRAVVERYMIEIPSELLPGCQRTSLIREIREFRDAGGKTAVVSDYPASQKLAALGVRALFDEVVANGEPSGPQQLKPSPDGMLRAAERLGVIPARCLVLGDRKDADGQAAAAAGMAFRWIH